MEGSDHPCSVCSAMSFVFLSKLNFGSRRLMTISDPVNKVPFVLDMLYPLEYLEETLPDGKTRRRAQTDVRLHLAPFRFELR